KYHDSGKPVNRNRLPQSHGSGTRPGFPTSRVTEDGGNPPHHRSLKVEINSILLVRLDLVTQPGHLRIAVFFRQHRTRNSTKRPARGGHGRRHRHPSDSTPPPPRRR